MIVYTQIYARATVNSAWPYVNPSEAQKQLIAQRKQEFLDTGLLLREYRDISEDYLVLEHVMEFATPQAYAQYLLSPTVVELDSLLGQDCQNKGIVRTTDTRSS